MKRETWGRRGADDDEEMDSRTIRDVDLGTMDDFYKDERVRGINRSNRF